MVQQNAPSEFQQAIAEAARVHADRYVRILQEYGEPTPDQIERFHRVSLRMFSDGVAWSLNGLLSLAARNLADLGQIGPIVETHLMLSEILYAAGVRQGTNTPGGDGAGQDDQREI